MGEVVRPHEAPRVQEPEHPKRWPVVLEGQVHVLAEVLAWRPRQVERTHVAVALVVVVHAVHPVRRPAGIGLYAHDTEPGMALEDPT